VGERSRRTFLREAGGLIAGTSLSPGWARAGATAAPASSLEAFPLAGLVESFRRDQLRPPLGWRETRAQRDDYLKVVAGIVRFFAAQQDARGAIVDPYERKEKQYATPAFALAAAVLHASGQERGLLEACLKAMERASADLAAGAAADGHADFYTFLLMHADRALANPAPPERRAGWQRQLASIAPEKTYRSQPGDPSASNWNLVAASGEWLRHRAGLAPDTRWIEASLARQRGQFTSHGMYRDPGDPMAYDHFARLHMTSLLEEGYDGPESKALAELLERGAWTSLLMQSPRGELPCGGRSGLHQWNEAQQAMTFEVQARRLMRRGDHAAAGAFKRAAHLALRSVSRWVRPSGEVWIVKNRVDPALRHGYEPYSFHSQYNLLTAAQLALAYLAAEDRIPERPCPAEVGGFAFALTPAFHKIFLNASGFYVEMETAGDPRYNPSGILRVHHSQFDAQLLSDGATPQAAYGLPRKPTLAVALAPAWRDGSGAWFSLAGLDGAAIRESELRVDHASPDRVECEVVLRGALPGGASAVRQSLFLTPKLFTVTATVDGEVFGVRQTCPLLRSDGREDCVIDMAARSAAVHAPGNSGLIFEASGPGAASMSRLGVSEPTRVGFVDVAVAETGGKTLRCVLRPIAADAGR
jgi:hypothetical protein